MQGSKWLKEWWDKMFFLPKSEHWDAVCMEERLDFSVCWILPLYRLNSLTWRAGIRSLLLQDPQPRVSWCFHPCFHAQPIARVCVRIHTKMSDRLFRLSEYISRFWIIWKCNRRQFATDKTRHQTELPSTSSPDRPAWSTKHNSVWLPLKSVFFFFFKSEFLLPNFVHFVSKKSV